MSIDFELHDRSFSLNIPEKCTSKSINTNKHLNKTVNQEFGSNQKHGYHN